MVDISVTTRLIYGNLLSKTKPSVQGTSYNTHKENPNPSTQIVTALQGAVRRHCCDAGQ
jgi:hypothetical protein